MKKTVTLLFFSFFMLQIVSSQCDIPGATMDNFLDVTDDFEYDFGVELDSTLYMNGDFPPLIRTLLLVFSDLFGELIGAELDEFVNAGLGQNIYTPGANGTAQGLQLIPGKFLNVADAGTAIFPCGESPLFLEGSYKHVGVDTDTAIVVVILDDEPTYDPIFNSDFETFEEILNADVDAVGFKLITGGPDEYTNFQVPIQYNTTESPDSALIYMVTFGDSINLAAGNEMYYVFDELFFTDVMINTDDLDRSESISIAPNPTTDMLRIEMGDYILNHYNVYDATGQIILHNKNLSSQQQQIDVSLLPPGAYFLEMEMDGYFARKKFVKM